MSSPWETVLTLPTGTGKRTDVFANRRNGMSCMYSPFYDSAYTNFVNALMEISKQGLQSHFQKRVDKIIANFQSSGYGFPDMMEDAYAECWNED